MAAKSSPGLKPQFGILGAEVGEGAYGTVYKTNRGYAVKIISNDTMDLNKELINELVYPMNIIHPAIIKYQDIYFDRTYEEYNTNIVMPLYPYDMHNYNLFDEKHSLLALRKITFKLISAVAFLHSYGIIHRDIKPSNILYNPNAPPESKFNVVLADFGLAVDRECLVTSYGAGTTHYAPPEIVILGEPVNILVDVWALGVSLYEIAMKKYLFKYGQGETDNHIYHRVGLPWGNLDNDRLRQKYIEIYTIPDDNLIRFHGKTPLYIPRGMLDFLDKNDQNLNKLLVQMLDMNPKTRTPARRLLEHPYLKHFKSGELGEKDLNTKQILYPAIPPTSCLDKMLRTQNRDKYDYRLIITNGIIPLADYHKMLIWLFWAFQVNYIAYDVRFLALETLLRYFLVRKSNVPYSFDLLQASAMAALNLALIFLTRFRGAKEEFEIFKFMTDTATIKDSRNRDQFTLHGLRNRTIDVLRDINYDLISSTKSDLLSASFMHIPDKKAISFAMELALLGAVDLNFFDQINYPIICIQLAEEYHSGDVDLREQVRSNILFRRIKHVFGNRDYDREGEYKLQGISPIFYERESFSYGQSSLKLQDDISSNIPLDVENSFLNFILESQKYHPDQPSHHIR